jgi:hypothetical protein
MHLHTRLARGLKESEPLTSVARPVCYFPLHRLDRRHNMDERGYSHYGDVTFGQGTTLCEGCVDMYLCLERCLGS